jgi:teichuronic acid biosynthesis glycosyltransferase TuaC
MTRSIRRILMCSMAVPWPTRPTLCAFHHDQARALAELGTEMRLFSPVPRLPRFLRHVHPRLRGHIDRPQQYTLHGVKTESPRCAFVFPPWVRHRLAAKHPQLVAKTARVAIEQELRRVVAEYQPDVLLGHGVMPLGRLLQSLSRDLRVPYAIIEHSAGDVMRLKSGSALAQHYAEVAAEAERVFVVGTWMRSHLQRLGWANVSQIPNGAGIPTQRQLLRPRPAELQGRKVVLSAATYGRRKGFEEVIGGFARIALAHPDALLVLVTDACARLRRQVVAAGIADRVQVLPLMSQEDLKQWMVWADLFAMPSWSEAFGLVYVEALACRTPVLMTTDCGLAPQLRLAVHEPSREHHGWLVPPRNIGAVADALDDALLHPAHLEQMGSAGRDFVRRRFTWRQNAVELLAGLGQDPMRFHEPSVLLPRGDRAPVSASDSLGPVGCVRT